MGSPRKINQATRDMIGAEEGRVFFAYDDAVSPPRPARASDKIKGTLTIGSGHTGPDVFVGQTVTAVQLDALLDEDLLSAETTVSNLVTVELDDNQYGVLVSLTENIGGGAFKGSTLLKLVNAGKFSAVPFELMKWDHTRIGGKLVESNGLKNRRKREGALWVSAPVNPTFQPGGGTAVGAKPTAKPGDAALSGIFAAGLLGFIWKFFTGEVSAFDYVLAFGVFGLMLVFLTQFLRKGK